MQTLCLWVPEPADFPGAREAALNVGRARLGDDAVLWSWWEAHSGRTSIGPDYRCSEDEHAWEVYGRVRGATLKISVNGGQYEFCFGRGSGRQRSGLSRTVSWRDGNLRCGDITISP
jgi:hypothetical protein